MKKTTKRPLVITSVLIALEKKMHNACFFFSLFLSSQTDTPMSIRRVRFPC